MYNIVIVIFYLKQCSRVNTLSLKNDLDIWLFMNFHVTSIYISFLKAYNYDYMKLC